MSEYVKVATTDQIETGKARLFQIKDQQIALFNVEGTYYAIEDKCSHRGAPLSEGSIRGTRVICPWHYAEFDITTGKILGGCAPRDQRSFPVRVSGDAIEVEV